MLPGSGLCSQGNKKGFFMKILFVDDQEELLEIYQEELSHFFPEHEVETALNGELALTLCQEKAFDIIFTDGKMPVMDGIEFARQLKEMNYKTHLVMITGHHEHTRDIDMASLNFKKVLSKPISFDGLISYIKEVKL